MEPECRFSFCFVAQFERKVPAGSEAAVFGLRNGGDRVKAFRNVLLCVIAAASVAACGPMSSDRFGVYRDGDFYIVVNHVRQKINFTATAHPGPDELLQDIENGKGIGYKTWRDKTSCGLTDDKKNSFVIPRSSRVERDGLTYAVMAEAPVFAKVNGGPTHETTVLVTSEDGTKVMGYVYDDTLGIRSLDRYHDGKFERRIQLESGVGLLGHCRGVSVYDFSSK